MTQIGDLRSALRDNLKQIPGVSVSRFALVNPSPPGFHLWPSEVPTYHKTFGAPGLALVDVEFTVQAFVAFGTNEGSQEMMDAFLGVDDLSVAAALEADRTLGGLCDDLIVTASSGYGFLVTSDNRPLLTSDWAVTVVV